MPRKIKRLLLKAYEIITKNNEIFSSTFFMLAQMEKIKKSRMSK